MGLKDWDVVVDLIREYEQTLAALLERREELSGQRLLFERRLAVLDAEIGEVSEVLRGLRGYGR